MQYINVSMYIQLIFTKHDFDKFVFGFSPRTCVSELFAILRQWVPQTQRNICLLVEEILSRGANINDKDGLTDMSLLHYAAKSGAAGVGNIESSTKCVQSLLERGADVMQKSCWTDMSALHYAVFFDIHPVVALLLKYSGAQDVDRKCKEFENGSPLHIACSYLSINSATLLLQHGANPHCTNSSGKTPMACIPQESDFDKNSKQWKIVGQLKKEISKALVASVPTKKRDLSLATLQALGLALGDQVTVAGRIGTLRFCGSTDFASGQWAGVELIEPVGKNDGSVLGIQYFSCKHLHGVFAPLTRIRKYDGSKIVALSVTPSPNSTRSSSAASTTSELHIGDRVVVAGQKSGILKFVGKTKFAPGVWAGIDLEGPSGKNDGSVAGHQYFDCPLGHGVFAPIAKIEKFVEEEVCTDDTDQAEENVNSVEEENQNNSNRSSLSPIGRALTSSNSVIVKIPTSPTAKSTTPSSIGTSGGSSNSDAQDLSKSSPNQTNPSVASSSPPKNGVSNVRKLPNINKNVEKDKGRVPPSPKHDDKPIKTFDFQLKTGMSIYVNSELGIVRYIGKVEFASGTWLGVELRKPSEYLLLCLKSRFGSRYFTSSFKFLCTPTSSRPKYLSFPKQIRSASS